MTGTGKRYRVTDPTRSLFRKGARFNHADLVYMVREKHVTDGFTVRDTLQARSLTVRKGRLREVLDTEAEI